MPVEDLHKIQKDYNNHENNKKSQSFAFYTASKHAKLVKESNFLGIS